MLVMAGPVPLFPPSPLQNMWIGGWVPCGGDYLGPGSGFEGHDHAAQDFVRMGGVYRDGKRKWNMKMEQRVVCG